ncbi:MAG: type II secretion system F family protein [Beijerinckiaceae bacterium]
MEMNQIITIVLVLVAVGGIGVVVAPYLSGDIRGEQRQSALINGSTGRTRASGDKQREANQRRKQIADSLKEMEATGQGKKKKQTLEAKLIQAGLDWPKSRFYLLSAVMALVFCGGVFFVTRNPMYAGAGLIVGGLGFPNWLIGYLRKRRINKFIQEFPNAVDVIIRGVKAGLPLGDCLRIIAAEAAEPVRSEFRRIVEAQSIGLSMGEAVNRLYESIPTAEANFFGIVINIQQKAGGNLSEALGNLSRVLRERKKMKLKIQAMSSEAKSSAYIIGALPFIVSGMVYLTSPRYMEILWLHPTGRMVMAIAGFWMFIGIMAMKKMVNFDF